MAKPKQNTQPIEVTLPSGIFARIRPASFLDSLFANRDSNRVAEMVSKTMKEDTEGMGFFAAAIIARIVQFDEERWTVEQVLDLDARDSAELLKKLGPYLTGPIIN